MTNNKHKTVLPGKCYLVGAGPGDAGLITVKGIESVKKADVLVYDALVNKYFLTLVPEHCEKIDAGKRAKKHKLTQDQTNALLVEKAIEGKTVVRLKGGDPMIFARGGEEAQQLEKAGIPYEIVPGISSAIAGPIYAGIPVTHRDCNTELTIFTGHEDPTKEVSSIDYERLAKTKGTLVMLMGVSRLRTIMEEFEKHGMDQKTSVALVRWATTEKQDTITGEVGTIADIAEKVEFKAPAVCVIGEVVKYREEIQWFDKKPIFGRRVVITRTRSQASELSDQLRGIGADVVEIPTIRVQKAEKQKELFEVVQDAHKYDWLVFTSPNGVDHFFDVFYQLYTDARSIGGARIAAIGPGTAKKLAEYRIATDLMPEGNFVAEGLVQAFEQYQSVENIQVLWVRGKKARKTLSDYFIKAGAILDEAIAYETVQETDDLTGAVEDFKENGADVITFTSASTVENFFKLGVKIPKKTKIVTIGPVTSQEVRNHGREPDLEASENTIGGVVNSVKTILQA